MALVDLLQFLSKEGGSDLILKVGSPPHLRRDGKLVRTQLPVMGPAEIDGLAAELLAGTRSDQYARTGEMDVAQSVPGLGRFRINLYRQRGSASLAVRRVVGGAPALSDLGVPHIVEELADATDGLVIVAGPAGSGKTTTASAMLDRINTTMARHIVTIEDPIEVLHADKRSLVSQREVGTDTVEVADAIRRAGRQDADVIYVSDLPDDRCITEAVAAAGKGRLVIASMSTVNAVDTVQQLIDAFPPGQDAKVRQHVAAALRGIVCMHLLKRADGRGRVPAVESLIVTARVRRAIADHAEPTLLEQLMTDGEYYGMQTLDQALYYLFREDKIDLDEALLIASRPEELRISADSGNVPAGE